LLEADAHRPWHRDAHPQNRARPRHPEPRMVPDADGAADAAAQAVGYVLHPRRYRARRPEMESAELAVPQRPQDLPLHAAWHRASRTMRSAKGDAHPLLEEGGDVRDLRWPQVAEAPQRAGQPGRLGHDDVGGDLTVALPEPDLAAIHPQIGLPE